MKKHAAYVNMETVKNKDGRIEEFKIRTVSYLPSDSAPTISGEGQVSDRILYRPLTINYGGTSTNFAYFPLEFTVKRDDVGLLERGVKVKVKPNGVPETRATMAMTEETLSVNEAEEGTTLEYEDPGEV